jgi:hypothetical protein
VQNPRSEAANIAGVWRFRRGAKLIVCAKYPSMTRKSGYRFVEKVMLKQDFGAR